MLHTVLKSCEYRIKKAVTPTALGSLEAKKFEEKIECLLTIPSIKARP